MDPIRHRVKADDFALLVDSVRDYAMLLLSPSGEILSWNRGAKDITGYDADEAVGHHFSLIYPPEVIESGKPDRTLTTARAEGRVEDEGWRRKKDGSLFWVNTVITALRDEDGELRGFAKITRDLTRRRESEETLRRSEEFFRLLVAAVKEYAIFLLDPNGNVTTWNAGAQRIKGYTQEEIIGRHFSTFYSAEDIRDQKPQHELEVAKRFGSVEDEGWRIRKDGSRFWANVIITAVYDETGALRGFAKITRDITERKKSEEMQRALFEQREARFRAEEERRRAEDSYRVAQEANRAKDEFLMTLSHELRTPMTAILGWARLLPTMRPEEQEFSDAIAAIGRSALLQARLIEDVLDVSRIVSGKLRLSIESVDLQKVIHGAIEAVRASADARGISIIFNAAENIGTAVADPTRLQQVLWNLLTNAVKFTPKKGAAITVDARRTSSHIQISVTDSGEGIDPQFLPHIFEAFRQAETASTRVHGGLGLGLSIVRYLTEAHGGTVTAESQGRGKGSRFTITLPVGAMKMQPETPPKPEIEPREAVMASKLAGIDVLIVDDDREARDLVRATLKPAGAHVVIAESAEAALSELMEYRPDLVLTDIAMPLMDGYALAREIRKRPELNKVKIVALSAFPAGRVARDSGFDEYLAKPIDPFDLVDAVARIAGPVKT